jgi:hypothetical protein
MVTAEAEVAVVQEDLHVGEVPETGIDAFVARGGRVMHSPWSHGVGPERAALAVSDDGGLHRVLVLLARDEHAPAAAAGQGAADLDLGGVQPQLDALGLGIGEHIRPGPQPQARAIGDRTSTLGQKSADLTDRASDSGAADAEQQPQHQCGRSCRRWISVATSRSTKTS